MGAILIGRMPASRQFQKSFMYKRSGLQRHRFYFTPQMRARQLFQLVVYQWNYNIQDTLIAGFKAFMSDGMSTLN